MNILEFAGVTQEMFRVNYNPGLGIWQAAFEHGEIKDNGGLASMWGGGKTVEEAINDYLRQIRGRTIVFQAMQSLSRKEFFVLQDITGLPYVPAMRGGG